VLGVPLADDERFTTNPSRVRHREELRSALEAALARAGADTWRVSLTAAGVPCGPVNDIADAVRLADSLGLAPVVGVPDGGIPQVANPLRMSATPPSYRSGPPRMQEASP
jgi:crotonobetainyl-CoA:carnitine CoA-transferase CaiB-like acyl-CoA transferase